MEEKTLWYRVAPNGRVQYNDLQDIYHIFDNEISLFRPSGFIHDPDSCVSASGQQRLWQEPGCWRSCEIIPIAAAFHCIHFSSRKDQPNIKHYR